MGVSAAVGAVPEPVVERVDTADGAELVAHLQAALRKRDKEGRETQERENRKGAVLFGEVTRLGKAIEAANGKTDLVGVLSLAMDAAASQRLHQLNVDLTNQDVPWTPIGQLTALEEISMWNCGLTGVIDAEALCRLTALQVLALRQNKLHGTIPECMATLSLEWLRRRINISAPKSARCSAARCWRHPPAAPRIHTFTDVTC